MIVAGVLAILVGWLMILSMQSRRWVRITLGIVGTWLLAAGMATVVQARL